MTAHNGRRMAEDGFRLVEVSETCPRCASCPDCQGRGVIPVAKVCANETCGKVFRFQQGDTERRTLRTVGVIYCSRACARAQAERQRRRRRQARDV